MSLDVRLDKTYTRIIKSLTKAHAERKLSIPHAGKYLNSLGNFIDYHAGNDVGRIDVFEFSMLKDIAKSFKKYPEDLEKNFAGEEGEQALRNFTREIGVAAGNKRPKCNQRDVYNLVKDLSEIMPAGKAKEKAAKTFGIKFSTVGNIITKYRKDTFIRLCECFREQLNDMDACQSIVEDYNSRLSYDKFKKNKLHPREEYLKALAAHRTLSK